MELKAGGPGAALAHPWGFSRWLLGHAARGAGNNPAGALSGKTGGEQLRASYEVGRNTSTERLCASVTDLSGRPSWSPALASCTHSKRDATRASPTPSRICRGDPRGRPPCRHARIRDGTPQGRPLHRHGSVGATLVVARPGVVHAFETGRHKGVPYTVTDLLTGDPRGRPPWRRARIRDGTPQGRPLHRHGSVRRPSWSPAPASCTHSRRDTTRVSPTPSRICRGDPCGRPPWRHARIRDGTPQGCPLHRHGFVGATLVVARLGVMHAFKTGHHKGVPYTVTDLYRRPLWSPALATTRCDG